MRKLLRHPLFILGLVIRLTLILVMAPLAVIDWYSPFLNVSTSMLTLDPWSEWVASGGALAAFPYGYVMWLAFLPVTMIAKFIGLPFHYGYYLTLLIADLCLLLSLHRFLPGRQRMLLLAYWLSPIIILASYGLGLNDLIPALLLVLSILYLREINLRFSGALLAAAISAKLSMVVALPFFVIYLLNNRGLRQRSYQFMSGFGFSILVLGGAFCLSHDGIRMLFGNPEMEKIYQLAIGLNGNVSILVIPLIYFVMLYLVWRIRRLNFDLFQAMIGLAFLLIVLLTPASPGWFVWCIPFLVLYQAMSGRIAVLMVGLFSGVYVLTTLILVPLRFVNGQEFLLGSMVHSSGWLGSHITSLLYTIMASIGLILGLRAWREGIGMNNFFRLSRKPFVLGIAGDSGAGKDTFADALAVLFGTHSVAKLSGDDYHLWDRQKPIWQVMTHLNPMANDLERFSGDLLSLVDGKSIMSRHYDHGIGKMSKPGRVDSNDFIIVSGLHAFYLPTLRASYDLMIYLDIDEGLRRHFKIQRDVFQRGHSIDKVLSSFEKRAPDSERFIRPQSKYADLILCLQPVHSPISNVLDSKHENRLKLVVCTRNGFNELSMIRVLVGVCGMHVDFVVSDDGEDMRLTIEGDVTAEDIADAAKILCPNIQEFLDIPPKWHDGMLGLMQLFALSHISQALTRRITR